MLLTYCASAGFSMQLKGDYEMEYRGQKCGRAFGSLCAGECMVADTIIRWIMNPVYCSRGIQDA